MAKYADLTTDSIFLPLAFQSLDPINLGVQQFIKQLGRHVSENSGGDIREESFLFQQFSMASQRFIAISLRGTFSIAHLEESFESRHKFLSLGIVLFINLFEIKYRGYNINIYHILII